MTGLKLSDLRKMLAEFHKKKATVLLANAIAKASSESEMERFKDEFESHEHGIASLKNILETLNDNSSTLHREAFSAQIWRSHELQIKLLKPFFPVEHDLKEVISAIHKRVKDHQNACC